MPETQCGPLSERFDPQALADRNFTLTGQLSADSMQRLSDAVVSMVSRVNVDLQLARTRYGHCLMDGNIVCTLGLRCVRCLDEVGVLLNPAVKLVLKSQSEAFIEQPEGYDLYEYTGNSLELTRLIEDELLLALPLAPKHMDISLCNQDMIAWFISDDMIEEHTQNPFTILKR